MCIFFRFARGTEGVCFGGNYKAGRTNEGGKDLNRDFPSHKQKGQSIDELKLGRQTETQILIDFILKHPFVLSANFHDGAVLANYPYDDYRKRDRTGISRTPDHDVFYHLATTYSFNHAFMNPHILSSVQSSIHSLILVLYRHRRHERQIHIFICPPLNLFRY